MKSKNTNCGAATGLAPQSCMSDGFIIKQLDDLRADIDELNRIFSDYEKSQALRTETAHLEVTKDANIKKANIEDLTAPKAIIKDLNADKVLTPLIAKRHFEGIAIENDRQTICTFRGSARLDIKLDVLPGQSEVSQGVQYISLRINDGIVSAMSTDPIYANTVELSRQDDGSVAVFINNLLRDKSTGDVIVLRASLFAEAEDFKVNVAQSYRNIITTVNLINGITVSGNINVDNKEAIKFESIDVTNLNVANKLRLGDFLLEYPGKELFVPAGKTLYFWLNNGILKVKNSSMLLRFANSKIIEAIGDPNYILSRPDAPTNSTGVLIKRADGKEFNISSEMAFYNTNVSQPYKYNILDDVSAFEPVVISKDGIHYLGRKSGVGSLVAKEVTSDVINTTDVNTEVLNASQLVNTESITADSALIKGLDVNDINFTNSSKFSIIDPTKFQYMKISGLDSGMFCLKIMDGDQIAVSATILRNTAYTSNTIVTYACQSISDFEEMAEDAEGNIYFKFFYSGNTYYWGHTGVSKDNKDPILLEPGIEPVGLFHKHRLHKLQHTVILGDGTNAYGIEIDGEVLAKLIPFPGISAFEDLAVSNTFSVGGNSQFGGDVSITGNIYQKGDIYETHAQELYTTEDMIITRDTKVLPDGTKVDPGPLADGELTGIKALHYDTAKNNGVLAFDNKGVARVGDEGDEKPIAVRDEADMMKENHLAAWQGKNKDSGLGEDKLFTPDTIVEGFVRNAETHKAINIKGKNLDINSLDKNANVFGNVYTGLGNDWTVQENLPEEARGSVGFCLEVLPNSHNVIHVYTINKPSGVITWKRRYDNNTWGDWNKVSMLDKDGYVEKALTVKDGAITTEKFASTAKSPFSGTADLALQVKDDVTNVNGDLVVTSKKGSITADSPEGWYRIAKYNIKYIRRPFSLKTWSLYRSVSNQSVVFIVTPSNLQLPIRNVLQASSSEYCTDVFKKIRFVQGEAFEYFIDIYINIRDNIGFYEIDDDDIEVFKQAEQITQVISSDDYQEYSIVNNTMAYNGVAIPDVNNVITINGKNYIDMSTGNLNEVEYSVVFISGGNYPNISNAPPISDSYTVWTFSTNPSQQVGGFRWKRQIAFARSFSAKIFTRVEDSFNGWTQWRELATTGSAKTLQTYSQGITKEV